MKLFASYVLIVSILVWNTTSIMAQTAINKGEYFIDTDPGFNNGTAIGIGNSTNDTSLVFQVPTVNLKTGYHKLFVRLATQLNKWSIVQSAAFFVMPTNGGIGQVEYFFDSDPGLGNGHLTVMNAFPKDTSVQLSINTSSLKSGFHKLFVRTKDQKGNWSIVQSAPLWVLSVNNSVAGAEYFFDSDPGFGSGTNIVLSSNPQDTSVSIPLGLTGLKSGFHRCFVRTKNLNGQWSVLQSSSFYLMPSNSNQALCEYFFDTDPGFGLGTQVNLTSLPNDTSVAISINTSILKHGFHKLYVRTKNQQNQWSVLQSASMYYLNNGGDAVSAEFFVDSDLGLGKGKLVNMIVTGDSSYASTIFNIDSFASGTHKLFARARSNSQVYSVVQNATFCKGPGADFVIPTSFCMNKTFTITNKSKDTLSNTTYKWDIGNDGSIDRTRKDTIQVNFSDSGLKQIKLIISTPGACADDSIVKTIDIKPTTYATIAISASSNPICSGDTVTFTSAIVNGGNAPTYQWSKNNVTLGGETNAILKTNNIADGDFFKCTLRSNSTNCLGSILAGSNSITMNVATVVTPDIQITSNDTIRCKGDTVTIISNSNGVGSSPVYSWFKNGSLLANQSGNFIKSTTIGNSDSIYAVIFNGSACATKPYDTSNILRFKIDRKPIASFSFASATACLNSAIVASNLSTDTNSNSTYKWYQGTNNSLYSTRKDTIQLSYVDTGNKLVKLVVTNPGACASDSISKSIQIKPNAVATIVINASKNNICSFDTVLFSSTITNGGTAPQYQWYKNDTVIAGANNATYTTTGLKQADRVYCKLYSNATNCVPIPLVTSNTIFMISVQGITPEIVLSSNTSSAICEGTNVRLTGSFLAGMGGSAPQYKWYKNDILVSGQTTSSYQLSTIQNNDKFYVVLTSNAVCATKKIDTSNSITFKVNALPTAKIQFAGKSSNICQTDTVNLFTANNSSYSYIWKRDTSIISTAGSSVKLNGTGSYKLYVTDSAGCSNADSTSLVLVYPNPEAIIFSQSPINLCEGDSIKLEVKSAFGNTYQWYNRSAPLAGNNTSILFRKDSGSYNVTVTSLIGCVSKSSFVDVKVRKMKVPVLTALNGIVNSCKDTTLGMRVSFNNTDTLAYQWYRDNQVIPNTDGFITVSNLSVNRFENKSGAYKVRIQNLVGCSMLSNELLLSIGNPSVLKSENGLTGLCLDDRLKENEIDSNMYPVLSVSKTPGIRYTWYLGNTVVKPLSEENTHLVEAIGRYRVLFTKPGVCSVFSNDFEIKPNLVPQTVIASSALFTDSVNLANFATGKIDLLALYDPNNLASSYTKIMQWYKNDQGLPGKTSASLNALGLSDTGRYTVTVAYLQNGCYTTSDNVWVYRKQAVPPGVPSVTIQATQNMVISNITNAQRYEWFVNDVMVAKTTNSTLELKEKYDEVKILTKNTVFLKAYFNNLPATSNVLSLSSGSFKKPGNPMATINSVITMPNAAFVEFKGGSTLFEKKFKSRYCYTDSFTCVFRVTGSFPTGTSMVVYGVGRTFGGNFGLSVPIVSGSVKDIRSFTNSNKETFYYLSFSLKGLNTTDLYTKLNLNSDSTIHFGVYADIPNSSNDVYPTVVSGTPITSFKFYGKPLTPQINYASNILYKSVFTNSLSNTKLSYKWAFYAGGVEPWEYMIGMVDTSLVTAYQGEYWLTTTNIAGCVSDASNHKVIAASQTKYIHVAFADPSFIQNRVTCTSNSILLNITLGGVADTNLVLKLEISDSNGVFQSTGFHNLSVYAQKYPLSNYTPPPVALFDLYPDLKYTMPSAPGLYYVSAYLRSGSDYSGGRPKIRVRQFNKTTNQYTTLVSNETPDFKVIDAPRFRIVEIPIRYNSSRMLPKYLYKKETKSLINYKLERYFTDSKGIYHPDTFVIKDSIFITTPYDTLKRVLQHGSYLFNQKGEVFTHADFPYPLGSSGLLYPRFDGITSYVNYVLVPDSSKHLDNRDFEFSGERLHTYGRHAGDKTIPFEIFGNYFKAEYNGDHIIKLKDKRTGCTCLNQVQVDGIEEDYTMISFTDIVAQGDDIKATFRIKKLPDAYDERYFKDGQIYSSKIKLAIYDWKTIPFQHPLNLNIFYDVIANYQSTESVEYGVKTYTFKTLSANPLITGPLNPPTTAHYWARFKYPNKLAGEDYPLGIAPFYNNVLAWNPLTTIYKDIDEVDGTYWFWITARVFSKPTDVLKNAFEQGATDLINGAKKGLNGLFGGKIIIQRSSSNLLTPDIKGESYQWYIEGVKLDNDTNESIAPKKDGHYTVVVTDRSKGAMESLSYFYKSDLSVEPFVYPNPTTKLLNIIAVKQIYEMSYFELYDINGKKVGEWFNDDTKEGKVNIKIDLPDLDDGLYFLRYQIGEKLFQSKIVIEN